MTAERAPAASAGTTPGTTPASCPACSSAVPVSARFCGRCGARVAAGPRTPQPSRTEQPRPFDDEPSEPPPTALRRPALATAAIIVGVVAVVAALLLQPDTPTLPPSTAGPLGAGGGAGVTDDVAVRDLDMIDWEVRAPISDMGVIGMRPGLTLSGDTLLVATTDLAGYDTRTWERRWRLPIAWGHLGPPPVVDGRVPVVRGDQLLWFRVADGQLDERVTVTADTGMPPSWPASLGNGLLLTGQQELVALRPAGTVAWTTSLAAGGGEGLPPPQVLASTADLAIVAQWPHIAAIDASDGTIRWESSPGYATPPARGPAVVGDTLVLVIDGSLVGIDAADGQERWRVVLGRRGGPTATLESPLLEIEDGIARVQEPVGPPEGASVRRFEVSSGGELDPLVIEHIRRDSGLIATDRGYLGEGRGGLTLVDRAGTTVWEAVGLYGERQTAAAGDVLVSAAGGLRFIDLRTGDLAALRELAGSRRWFGPRWRPAISRGRLLLPGSPLTTVDIATGKLDLRLDSAPGEIPVIALEDGFLLSGGDSVRRLDRSGDERWRTGPEETDAFLTPVGTSSTHAVVRGHSDEGPFVRVVDLEDGTVTDASPDGMAIEMAVWRDGVFAGWGLDAHRRPAGLGVMAVGPEGEMQVRWQHDHDPRFPRPEDSLVLAADALYELTLDRLRAWSLGDGTALWEVALTVVAGTGAASDGRILVYGDGDRTMAAVDLRRRMVAWTTRLPASISVEPTIAGDAVYVADEEGTIHVVDLPSGELLESFATELGRPVGPLTVVDGHVLLPVESRLVAVASSTEVPATPSPDAVEIRAPR